MYSSTLLFLLTAFLIIIFGALLIYKLIIKHEIHKVTDIQINFITDVFVIVIFLGVFISFLYYLILGQ